MLYIGITIKIEQSSILIKIGYYMHQFLNWYLTPTYKIKEIQKKGYMLLSFITSIELTTQPQY